MYQCHSITSAAYLLCAFACAPASPTCRWVPPEQCPSLMEASARNLQQPRTSCSGPWSIAFRQLLQLTTSQQAHHQTNPKNGLACLSGLPPPLGKPPHASSHPHDRGGIAPCAALPSPYRNSLQPETNATRNPRPRSPQPRLQPAGNQCNPQLTQPAPCLQVTR